MLHCLIIALESAHPAELVAQLEHPTTVSLFAQLFHLADHSAGQYLSHCFHQLNYHLSVLGLPPAPAKILDMITN